MAFTERIQNNPLKNTHGGCVTLQAAFVKSPNWFLHGWGIYIAQIPTAAQACHRCQNTVRNSPSEGSNQSMQTKR